MLFRVGTIVGIQVNHVDGIAYVSKFDSTNNTISLKYVNGKNNLTERNNIPVNRVTILVTEKGNQLLLEVANLYDNDSIKEGLLKLYLYNNMRNEIANFNIEDYTEVNGGSRKSRRHKKTNRRRRKSNRRKSRRHKKSNNRHKKSNRRC